jgi:hypothetical protein
MENPLSSLENRIRAFMPRSLVAPSSEVEFNELAVALFEAQRSSNHAYARLIGAGKPPGDWREIPAAPTVAFKEMEMTSLAPEVRQRVFHSSGTTAQNPSRHFHSGVSLALYEESVRLWFDFNFAPRLEKRLLYFLTPHGLRAPHSSLAHMFETIAADRPLADVAFFGAVGTDASWEVDFARLVAALERAAGENRPIALFGTAFLFVHLLEQLPAAIQLPAGSWLLETGGYKGRSRELTKPEFHAAIAEKLRVSRENIFAEYGMSELSSQAYDGADAQFQFPPWARALVISPETGRPANEGERGLLRIVDLANIWSVAAVQTEDLAVRCGKTFALAGRATAAEARGCSLMSA